MKLSARRLQQYLPYCLGAGYCCFLMALLQQADRPEVSALMGLFTLTLLYHWWDTDKELGQVRWDWGAIASALLLTMGLIWRGWNYQEDEAFLRLLPLLSLTSWGLWCYGWQSFRILAEGFFLYSFLAFPWEITYIFVDLSLLTAKFSHVLLQLLGLTSERIGTLLRLGSGSIEVYHGCSGLKMMLQLLGFALMYMVLSSASRPSKVALGLGAIAIGFLLNGVRVALMAILVSLGDQAAFDYWHLGTGSLIFSGFGLGALGLWGWQVQRWPNH